MNRVIFSVFALLLLSCKQGGETSETTIASAETNTTTNTTKDTTMNTIYQFTVTDISGNEFDFSDLKGKKIMIVNTASECGLTPQYEQLEAIYQEFKENNFVIVGFPANNFGAQEPGSNQQIAAFCKKNYGVTFPMMSKISVKGDDMHEVYQFLTQKSKNGVLDSEVQWNFQKYLIDEQGNLVKMIDPRVLPNDSSIVNWIKS